MYYLLVVDEWCSDHAGVGTTTVYNIDNLADAWSLYRSNNYEFDTDGYSEIRWADLEVIHEPFSTDCDQCECHLTDNGKYIRFH